MKLKASDGNTVNKKYTDTDLSATLSSGKKTKGTVIFEVPMDAQEIEIEYKTNVFTEDKILFSAK